MRSSITTDDYPGPITGERSGGWRVQMETSTMPSTDLRFRAGKLALAIGFAFALGAAAVWPAMAYDRGHGGHPEAHGVRHDYGRRDYHPNYYYPPATYYAPPNYDYVPPPVYYYPPPQSEGWTFIFP